MISLIEPLNNGPNIDVVIWKDWRSMCSPFGHRHEDLSEARTNEIVDSNHCVFDCVGNRGRRFNGSRESF